MASTNGFGAAERTVPHHSYCVNHLAPSVQEPYGLLLSFVLPTTHRRDLCEVLRQHLSKKGLEVEKCRSKKLAREGCFSCVIPKPAKGRPVVCGPEPLPTRGHVFCQKHKDRKETQAVNFQPLLLQPRAFRYLN